MWIPISYLPVTTHFASMRVELTTRPQFGNEVFNDAPKYLRLLDVAVALKMAGRAGLFESQLTLTQG